MLNINDQLFGIYSLLMVSYCSILSIIPLFKAIQNKVKLLYYFFLFVLFNPYSTLAFAIGYLYWIFTGNVLSDIFYIYFTNIFLPIPFLAWRYIYLDILQKQKKKTIKILTLVSTIISIIYECYLFIFVFIYPYYNIVGELTRYITFTPLGFVLFYQLATSFFVLISGIHFGYRASISDTKNVKWKGRFIIIAFILMFISFFLMNILLLETLGFSILLIVLIIDFLSYFFLSLGFLLPKWGKKVLTE